MINDTVNQTSGFSYCEFSSHSITLVCRVTEIGVWALCGST